MRSPARIESALRHALNGPQRQAVQGALRKIDTLVAAIGYVLVTRKYLDAVSTLGQVGMHCECARQGLGECGINHGDHS